MPTRRRYHFLVSGSGSFPFDMLRYDECWPATQIAAERILDNQGYREVEVISYSKGTPARWESFGWSMELVS